jgi:hypothetical protein
VTPNSEDQTVNPGRPRHPSPSSSLSLWVLSAPGMLAVSMRLQTFPGRAELVPRCVDRPDARRGEQIGSSAAGTRALAPLPVVLVGHDAR